MALLGRRALLVLGVCFMAVKAHGARSAQPMPDDDGFVILHGWILRKSDLKQLDL